MNRITKKRKMFHHESWKLINFGSKSEKVKVTRHKNSACVVLLRSCETWLLLVNLMINFRLQQLQWVKWYDR